MIKRTNTPKLHRGWNKSTKWAVKTQFREMDRRLRQLGRIDAKRVLDWPELRNT